MISERDQQRRPNPTEVIEKAKKEEKREQMEEQNGRSRTRREKEKDESGAHRQERARVFVRVPSEGARRVASAMRALGGGR